jgi:hypothetical protein
MDVPTIAGLLKRLLNDPGFYRSPQQNQENICIYSWPRQMKGLHRLLVSLPLADGHAVH